MWNCSVYELLQAKHQNFDKKQLITIDYDTPVEQALEVLSSHRILSAPVEKEKKVVGIVGLFDILQFIISLYSKGSATSESAHGFITWFDASIKQRAESLFCELVGNISGIASRTPNLYVHKNSTVQELVKTFCEGTHQLLVMDDSQQTLGFLSQTDVIRFMNERLDDPFFDSVRDEPISKLNLGCGGALTLRETATALQGYYLLNYYHLRAVIVLDDQDKPVANLSISDLRGLNSSRFTSLLLPVIEYLDKYSPEGKKLNLCTPETKFKEILGLMVQNRAHRVWSIDQNGKVLGIVSQTDIIRHVSSMMDLQSDSIS